MSSNQQDLQATHQIIQLFERSKTSLEGVIDRLPDFFVMVDKNGCLLKGNGVVAEYYNVDAELLLGLELKNLFRAETWNLFQTYFNEVIAGSKQQIEFELPIDSEGQAEKVHYWSIRPLSGATAAPEGCYCIAARDISKLRAYEKQLSEIFASIPVVIITLGGDGKVEAPVSEYTRWLLGTPDLIGQKIRSLLFEPAWDSFNVGERRAIDSLANFHNTAAMVFSIFEAALPKKFRYPVPGSDEWRWLGLKYQPIIYGDVVKKVLIIIEDLTAVVMAEQAEAAKKMVEDKHIQRILQIKSVDPLILPDLYEELNALCAKLDGLVAARDLESLANTLHGIKGNSRVAGFEQLKHFAHDLESKILPVDGTTPTITQEDLQKEADAIKQEWDELAFIARSAVFKDKPVASGGVDSSALNDLSENLIGLVKRYNAAVSKRTSSEALLLSERLLLAIQVLQKKKVSSLEPILNKIVSETAGKLQKNVKVVYEFDQVAVDAQQLDCLRTCLLHLLNNAIDHGIEMPEVREKKGKSAQGTITVRGRIQYHRLLIELEDDGGGIDPERVKKVAIDRGVISVKEAMTMTDDQAVQLIFRPGFSTATQVTDISGRGVGLDAVAKSLKELGGGVEAKIGARGGTLFVINLAANKEWTMQPVCESLKDFVTNMQSDVGRSLQPGAKMNLLGAEKPEFQKGVLLADPLRLSVAITTLVADFAGPHEFDMVMGTERDRVTILVKVKSKSSTKDSPLDLSLPIPICEDCVRQHGGDIGREGDTLKIAFGHILGRQDLVVGMDADLEEAQKKAAKQAVEYLKVLQSELNLNLRVDTAKFQEGLSKWHAVVSTEARKSSFPKLTIGASQERLKADLLLALESAVMSNSSQGN